MSYLKLNDSTSSSIINSNRLLYQAEELNSKVNQYRKTLSLGITSTKNKSLSSSMRETGLSSHPHKQEYSSLNCISNAFTPMSITPSTDKSSLPQTKTTNLKQLYESHIKNLYSNFKASLSKIEELYVFNKAEVPSIKTILNEELFYERETQIEELIDEIADLKGRHHRQSNNTEMIQRQIETLKQQYERDIMRITNESNYTIDKLKKEAMKQSNSIKADNDEYKEELNRLKQQMADLNEDYNKLNSQLKERNAQNESLKRSYESIQEQLYDSSIKIKQYMDDNNYLKEVLDQYENELKDSKEKHSIYRQEQDSNNDDLLISYEKQHQSKHDSFDITIVNLKESNAKLEDELKCEREKLRLSKQSYNKLYEEMQEKVKLLSTEWEKKHKDQQKDYDRLVAEIEYKHKEQLKEVMIEKDSIIDDRNKELCQCKQIIEGLQLLQKESIKISEHEARVNEEINILKQQHHNDKVFIQEEYKIKSDNVLKEKKEEYDTAIEALNSKLEGVEKENGERKEKIESLEKGLKKEREANEKCNKDISELNKAIESKEKEINDLNNVIELKNKEISDYAKSIGDKDKEIANLNEQCLQKDNDISTNKQAIEDKAKQITLLENDKQKERTININLKNEIQELILNKRDLEAKITSNTETTALLTTQLTETIDIRDKLIYSLKEIRTELDSMKKYNLQLIHSTHCDLVNIIEGLKSKLHHHDTNNWNYIKDLIDQYEKQLKEQSQHNDELQQDNKTLNDLHEEDLNKINDLLNQLGNKDNDLSTLQSTIRKNKEEIETLNANAIDSNKKIEDLIEGMNQRVSTMKKHYQSIVSDIKSSIENLNQAHSSEIAQTAKNKSASLQNVIKALKNESIIKNDSMMKLKTLNQALAIDVDNKGDELANTKKEYDKLISIKDKKIRHLQNIITQSFNTYNNGLNSLKTTQKLNDEVRNLIRKANEDE